MTQLDDLLSFWNSFFENNTDYIHNDDLQAAKEIIAPEKSLEEFEKANNLETKNKHSVYSNLVPVPFTGDLKNAKIFFLLKNPGFSERDYKDELNRDFTSELKNQLVQKFENEMPFTWLNPKFKETGGYNYWTSKMNPLVKAVQKSGNLSYEEALKLVGSKIADIELYPYHSKDADNLSDRILNNTESVSKMRTFVKEYLLPKAKKGEILIYVVRAERQWDLITEIDDKTVFHGKSPRKFGIGTRKDFIEPAVKLILGK